MRSFWVPVVAVACSLPPEPLDDVPDPDGRIPSITRFELSCDADIDRWSLVVEADAWTGGGLLWLSKDGEYIEKHDVFSVALAEDGRYDRLELSLKVADDWRMVSPGASTLFSCGSRPYAVFQLFTQEDTVAACQGVGISEEVYGGLVANCP